MNRTKLRALALVAALGALVVDASAQTKKISGNVVSDLGLVVSNASVCVKGAERCATTDADGNYEIEAQAGDVVVFSRDGYAMLELAVGDSDELDATMVLEDLLALDLEDLMNTEVKSSSFLQLKAKEAPGYVFAYDLPNVSAQQSLTDIIRMVVPSYSDGSHPDCPVFGVRGMKVVDNSKSIVMYDGQNLNMRANIGYGVGLNSVLLGDVKGVEVSLGPNAIVHGSGAISGYINMLPKNGFDNAGFMVNVSKEFEKNAVNQASGISKAEVGYGFGTETRNAYIYAGWYHSNGWQADSVFAMNKLNGDSLRVNPFGNTPMANIRLSANANFDDFNLTLAYLQASQTSFNKGKRQSNFTRQFNGKVKWQHAFGDFESLALTFATEVTDLGRIITTTAGGSENHFEGKLVATTKRIPNNQLAVGALFGKREFRAGRFYFGSDFDPMTAEPVFQMSNETGKDVKEAEYLYGSAQMANGKWSEMAFFLEDVYKFQDKLVFALGLRYDLFKVDDFDVEQGNLSPRFGLSWLVNDDHVLKVAFQQGFRTADYQNMAQTYLRKNPQIQSYFIAAGDNDNANFKLELDPEKLNSFEFNYHGQFFGKVLSVDANVFYNSYKKTIDAHSLVNWNGKKSEEYTGDDRIETPGYSGDFTASGLAYMNQQQQEVFGRGYFGSTGYRKKGKDGSYQAFVNNGEDVNIAGGELIASVNLKSGTRLRATYSIAKSTTDSYAEKTLHPEQSLKVGLGQKLFADKVIVGAHYLFEPAIEDNELNRANYHDVYFGSRSMLDASVTYSPIANVSLYFMVNNITGEERPHITFKPSMAENYPENTTLGSAERRFWLGVKVNL